MKSHALILLLIANQLSCSLIQSDASALEKAKAKWNNSHISDYRMKVNVEKTGHATPMGNAIIEVHGDNVTRTRVQNEWIGGDIDRASAYDTVPEQFDMIDRAIREKAEILHVSYDSTYGYPTRISLDYNSRAMDDEMTWEVLEFEKLDATDTSQ